MTPSPRGDGSEMVVEVGSVPKTGQKNALPRGDATEMPVGGVPEPTTGQKTPFATRGCHRVICGIGRRAEARSEERFATR
ncbi:MAG: hypothetical protein PUD74_07295 [Bacteroidales bacterium]|nr:hypothetical protein [Bacteroidales bacterium]